MLVKNLHFSPIVTFLSVLLIIREKKFHQCLTFLTWHITVKLNVSIFKLITNFAIKSKYPDI